MKTIIRNASITGLSAFIFALLGCTQSPMDSGASERQIQALNAKVAALETQVNNLRKSFDDEKQHQTFNLLLANSDRIAYLTPGSDGYSVLHYDLGTLTVQLADVEPYANGSRVTLRFGNTMAAAVNGLKLTIDWGTVTDQGPDNDHQKSKEMTFSTQLRSGAWTSVPVVLDGLPPAQLGFVRVRDVTHTGIALLGR